MSMPIYTFSDSSSGSHNAANGETLNAKAHDNPVGTTEKYIYIIKNSLNDKVYIGQAIDPTSRFKGHVQDKDRKQYSSAIDGAIKKYGEENFWFEILEGPTRDYNEREKFWISFFNSIAPNGYNILKGGEAPPIRKGFENNKSKFTPEDVNQIKQLLKNPTLSLLDISKAYGVTPKTISAINRGDTYADNETEYPIRNFRVSGESSNMVADEVVDQIIKDLKSTNLSFRKIAIKYSVNHKQVLTINDGSIFRYRREGLDYPLRCNEFKATDVQVNQIKKYLLEGILSKQQIANAVGVSYEVVSNINAGRSHFDENLIYPLKKHEGRYDWDEEIFEEIRFLLKSGMNPNKIASKLHLPNVAIVFDINSGKSHKSDNYTYPIRKRQDRFSIDEINAITYEIANTNKSLSQIAREHNMCKSNVICLKNGTWKKYRLDGYEYPLRKNN